MRLGWSGDKVDATLWTAQTMAKAVTLSRRADELLRVDYSIVEQFGGPLGRRPNHHEGFVASRFEPVLDVSRNEDAGVTAQLPDNLTNLGGACSSHRVSTGRQSAAWIERDSSAQPAMTFLEEASAFSSRTEVKGFILVDFPRRKSVVDFNYLQVCRSKSRHLVSRLGRKRDC